MAQQEDQPFTGFGLGLTSRTPAGESVYILAVYRDGGLTAAAHATERGAMEAAVAYLDDDLEEEGEHGTLADRYARAQGFVVEEGGVMEIIPSPVHGG